jgi:hypothetical protein
MCAPVNRGLKVWANYVATSLCHVVAMCAPINRGLKGDLQLFLHQFYAGFNVCPD